MAQEKLVRPRAPLFLLKILSAAEKADIQSFNELIGTSSVPRYHPADLQQLFEYSDGAGNTIFHLLLQRETFLFNASKKRNAKVEMCNRLLKLAKTAKSLNLLNAQGETPLHIAIKQGYENVVKMLLSHGSDLTIQANNISTLELAAKHNKNKIYQLLLEKHEELNKESEKPGGFTCNQIQLAQEIAKQHRKKKLFRKGFINALLAGFCPFGTVLAFYKLALLEIVLSTLIPVAGPIIGLVGFAVMVGLMCFSSYSKANMKYGAYADEMANLNARIAEISRLEAELTAVNKGMLNTKNNPIILNNLKQRKLLILNKLDAIYEKVEIVDKEKFKATDYDWATTEDKYRTYMITAGSFLCIFSGILGVIESLAYFAPAIVLTGALLGGIPVIGWAAMAVALTIGGLIVFAPFGLYSGKFKPTLAKSGMQRQELYEKKLSLCAKRDHYLETKTKGLEVSGILQLLSDNKNTEAVAPREIIPCSAKSSEKIEIPNIMPGSPPPEPPASTSPIMRVN